MALYLISYDIVKADAMEYGPLWKKLEAIGAEKILYSEWIVTGGIGEASTIYNEIAHLTTVNDRLLVQELTADAKFDKLLISDDRFRAFLQFARI